VALQNKIHNFEEVLIFLGTSFLFLFNKAYTEQAKTVIDNNRFYKKNVIGGLINIWSVRFNILQKGLL